MLILRPVEQYCFNRARLFVIRLKRFTDGFAEAAPFYGLRIPTDRENWFANGGNIFYVDSSMDRTF
jgi:hypothetical protein